MTDHRVIGVDLNNAVWARLDAGDVTESSSMEERQELLYAAFASTYHWLQVGNAANHARGEHLISRVAARTGFVELALTHARRCLELVEEHPDVTEDWDLAFALEALARAEAASGDVESARRTLERAMAATADITDPEDRVIVEGELARAPWFGLGS
jgi:hypothetical protein